MRFKQFLSESKSWSKYIGNYSVVVQQRLDGKWLASMGLKHQLDPHGTSTKEQVFDDVTSALRWVGYPAEQEIGGIYFPVPDELKS